MTYLQGLLLSFIEGLTEFLPISSTGHLIITSHFLGIAEDGFVKSFNIIIQFGAILSVLVLYHQRFRWNYEFYKRLLLAFLPAAVIGLLVKSRIDTLLDSVNVVAWSLLIGGLVLIVSDHFVPEQNSSKYNIENLPYSRCIALGLIQCLAFIPGVSRSGASILGGLGIGLSRKEAAEFSFFLAVPTLAGATFIKSLKVWHDFQTLDNLKMLLFGSFFSFLFATVAIVFFIRIVSRYGYKYFGIYRVLLGLFLILFV